MKQIRKRLTYANVMSSLAVFLVLGGASAMAANKIGTSQLKAGAVKTGKLAKNAVKASKLAKNAVTTAKIRNDAVTGAKVNEATLATVPSANLANTATIGAPAAYAQLAAGGGIDEQEPSRNIADANVTEVSPGVHCVDLPFAAKTGAGNAESQGSEDGIVSLELGAPYNECPDTAEAEVRIYDAGNGAEDGEEDIWVQFDS